MDREIRHPRRSFRSWPLPAKAAAALALVLLVVLSLVRLIAGSGEKVLRLSASQITSAEVQQGVFHDLIPLRARVVPRETVYVDAIDGGRIDRVLVEAGDVVTQGQPLIELSNTNLALSIIQQESQLNQAISQLQQNEIALEENRLANDRAMAEIEYSLVRLNRSADRRNGLMATNAVSAEQRDAVTDELSYYRKLGPIQADSRQRQSELRERLLPDIHRQLASLRENLAIVHGKLDSLIVRAPVAGRVTALDLKVGEHRDPGQRFAEVTPDAGMKLEADIDEFYLGRIRLGQTASVELDTTPTLVSVRRVSPQVRNGQFRIDLDFAGSSPAGLVAGATAQGRLQLGDDTPARLLPTGPFLERTGGSWVFVIAPDGKSATRRAIRPGRRTAEQLEILSGLEVGARVITSDYTGLDRVERLLLTP